MPAEATDWKFPPFAGEIAEGCVWGRGAVDMKDFIAVVLAVVRARARSGRIPSRPLALVLTADEEAGSRLGAQWLVEWKPDLIPDCTEAVGEVGGFSVNVQDQRLYLVQVGEKGHSWKRLVARGTAGDGSMENSDNPVHHLFRAPAAISDHPWDLIREAATQGLFAKLREITVDRASTDERLLDYLGPAGRLVTAGVTNSTAGTVLSAGYKHDVIPSEAVALVDGRHLLGHEATVHHTIEALVGDQVRVEDVRMSPALEVPLEGRLACAIHQSLRVLDPVADLAPFIMPGGTDAKAWSQLGMRSFGFAPRRLPDSLDFASLFHGVNERVPIETLTFGAEALDQALDFV